MLKLSRKARPVADRPAALLLLAIFLASVVACQSEDESRISYQGAVPPNASARLGKGTAEVLSFSPNGEALVVGGGVGLYLYDSETLAEIWLTAVPAAVRSVVFSGDGVWLAAGLEDSSLSLIDAATGRPVVTTDLGVEVTALAWSDAPAGPFLAIGGNNGDVALARVTGPVEDPTVTLLGQLPRLSAGVTALAYSPNGRLLATGDRTGAIGIWDSESLTQQGVLEGHERNNAVITLAWSADGSRLLSGGQDGLAIVWDAASQKSTERVGAGSHAILNVAFDVGGQVYFITQTDGRLQSLPLGQSVTGSNLVGSGELEAAAWSPDRSRLAVIGADGAVIILDRDENVVTEWQRRTLMGHTAAENWAGAVAWSTDGRWLASGLGETIFIWPGEVQREAIEPLRTLAGHSSLVTSLAWSADGKLLASAGRDRTIILWEGETGKKVRTLTGHGNSITDLAWSPNGSQLASAGSLDGTVIIWDVATGQRLHTLVGLEAGQWSVAWSPDGRTLASGTHSGSVWLWNMTQDELREPAETLFGHFNWVSGLAWSPDGDLLASAAADTQIILWDVAASRRFQTLTGHNHVVRSVAFSPDGGQLVSGANDQLAVIWDVVEGAETAQAILEGHTAEVDGVAWSPGGSTVASASRDGTILLWQIEDITP